MITALPRIAIAVADFDAAVATFRDGFGMPVVDLSGDTGPSLGARIAMAIPHGGSNIELMSPARADAPLAQALQRFLDRRGDGLYALMLEAPVPDDEAAALDGRGVRVLPLMPGAAGRDVHPSSTHGVLIRVYPQRSADLGTRPSAAPGLSGIAAVVVATADVAGAARAYGEGLGLTVGPAATGALGHPCLPVHAPSGAVIELTARDDGDDAGPGMRTLVLDVDDPAQALTVLAARGLPTATTPQPAVVACGTRFVLRARPAR
jgi:hypothetical protein